MNLWINKYAPKSINDYVGDQYQILLHYLDEFYKGHRDKSFILYGKPGTGKSALINVIGNYYNADTYIINGSDHRSNLDFDAMNAQSLSGQKRIIILEEIDGFDKKSYNELANIISICNNPIILICNDINLIDNIVKNKCIIKEIKVDRFALKNLANKIIEIENLDISNDQINDALKSIKSYRQLYDFLQFGQISEKGSFNKSDNFKDDLQYISDNSESPQLISLADIYFKQSNQKVANYILDQIDVKTSLYPRTYRMIADARKSKTKSGTISIIGFK